MFAALLQILQRTSASVARVEMFTCKALVVVFTLLLIVNVGLRSVFNSPLFFAEELAIYILIWMAFLAISFSLHENSQVSLTLVKDMLPPSVQRGLSILTDSIIIAILATVFWYAVKWVTSSDVDFELAISLGIQKKPFFYIIPLFCLTGLFHVLTRLLTLVFDREAAKC